MTKAVNVFLALALIAPAALAQSVTDVHQLTTTPPDARFEIVQSQLTAQWTFRLDRFTGHVVQLVKTVDDNTSWEDMTIAGLPDVPNPSRPRFQIFTSGIAARFTFLIDTTTGLTWQLVTTKMKAEDGTKYEVNSWQPF
jgi:hypothetical protein